MYRASSRVYWLIPCGELSGAVGTIRISRHDPREGEDFADHAALAHPRRRDAP
ncbi:hypothetical protein SM0020_07847 [Sinorhizobium meliloti CCNWSX0020]|uniref:Uncharacterized protein n=1 Tax=Sinorhizobium meliloti CCNWSX0020 TaxID=1107881 RepID=H0FWK5_RHIML|nr:hypothetical protein SM0020_07847 [Sinorhizobium meliloti CCNWSX0020]